MIADRLLDIENEHAKPTAELVDASTAPRPARSFRVSVVAGGVYAGATADDIARSTSSDRRLDSPSRIADDILDMTRTRPRWARPRARIWRQKKSPGRPSLESSRASATPRLIEEAFAALEPYGDPRRSEGRSPLPGLNGKTEKRKN